MYLQYTLSGHIYISPDDNCRSVVNAMLKTDYDKEFCVAEDFSPHFVSRLMEAGFLVMSANMAENPEVDEPEYILLPKLHLVRSVLFFENLHIKKSIRRFLSRYELRPDAEFDLIIDRCVEKHGGDWLTPPLVECIKKIRAFASCETQDCLFPKEANCLIPADARPVSFALYRDGKLAAGEFGVVCGRVYTGYSCFHDENNAGTVRFILTTRYLQEHGFSFFDFGMPMDYKTDIGAQDISPAEFVSLFRGQDTSVL